MRKTFRKDKVLFERGQWLIVVEEYGHKCRWMVHRCKPADQPRDDYDFNYGPYYSLELESRCFVCDTKIPDEIQTIWKLLVG